MPHVVRRRLLQPHLQARACRRKREGSQSGVVPINEGERGSERRRQWKDLLMPTNRGTTLALVEGTAGILDSGMGDGICVKVRAWLFVVMVLG